MSYNNFSVVAVPTSLPSMHLIKAAMFGIVHQDPQQSQDAIIRR